MKDQLCQPATIMSSAQLSRPDFVVDVTFGQLEVSIVATVLCCACGVVADVKSILVALDSMILWNVACILVLP